MQLKGHSYCLKYLLWDIIDKNTLAHSTAPHYSHIACCIKYCNAFHNVGEKSGGGGGGGEGGNL